LDIDIVYEEVEIDEMEVEEHEISGELILTYPCPCGDKF
jgi:hypothetical protein